MKSISNQQFQAIFEEAAIGIIISNAQGQIISSNKFANKLFGYENQELIQRNISDLIPQHLREKHQGLQSNYIKEPKSRPMGAGIDLKARKKDGSLFSVEISLSNYQDQDQPFFIAFVSDITKRRQVEMELILKSNEIQKLNEQLEEEVKLRTRDLEHTLAVLEEKTQDLEKLLAQEKELGDLKTRFVSMASHEFRTPLTSILTTANLLEKYQNGEHSEKCHRNLQRIKSSVFHLNEILEEFLAVGKIEEGKLSLHPKNQSIPEFIEYLLVDIQSNPAITNEVSTSIEFLREWTTDFSILSKILINLITNALKFSAKSIQFTIFQKGQNLHFIIKDEGIGISKEDQKHLFDRFFRGTNTSGIQGTGLGLYLVNRYLQMIGGEIRIESALNIGTKVEFFIPKIKE